MSAGFFQADHIKILKTIGIKTLFLTIIYRLINRNKHLALDRENKFYIK